MNLNCYLLQYDIVWENPGQNMSGILLLLEKHQIEKKSLVVLPEMFATGFSMNCSAIAQGMSGQIVSWMKETAQKYEILLAGSVAVKDNERFHNRFIWAFPDGRLEYYDKKHLFSPGGEKEFYFAGHERKIISYQGFRILPLVCYDLRFPVWSRNRNDYDLIVYAANWPKARDNAWNTLLPARAIENQAYVIGTNRTGQGNKIECCGCSQIIDFKGNILAKAGEEHPAIVHAELSLEDLGKYRQELPFWKDADEFELK